MSVVKVQHMVGAYKERFFVCLFTEDRICCVALDYYTLREIGQYIIGSGKPWCCSQLSDCAINKILLQQHTAYKGRPYSILITFPALGQCGYKYRQTITINTNTAYLTNETIR